MFISCAMRSRTVAVGVGFLLNSSSRVTSWSWVARWRFWFFCCWVKVLFLGGRRDAEAEFEAEAAGVPAVEPSAGGEGVEADMSALSASCKTSMVKKCYSTSVVSDSRVSMMIRRPRFDMDRESKSIEVSENR
jgi:hypothetical protein